MFVNIETEVNRIKIKKTSRQTKLNYLNNRLVLDHEKYKNKILNIDEILVSEFKKNLLMCLVDASENKFPIKYEDMYFLVDVEQTLDFTNLPIVTPSLSSSTEKHHKYYKPKPQYASSSSNQIIDIEDLHIDTEFNFPLCMRLAHEKLKQDHMLKNWGRMMFYSFLKQIGLPIKDIYNYLKGEHQKIMPSSVFMSKYRNDINYICGSDDAVGPKYNYNCNTIFKKSDILGDGCVGCPFKLFDADTLANKLESLKLDRGFIKQITRMRFKGDLASDMCSEYFKYMKGVDEINFVVSSPIVYYNNSRRLNK